MLKTPFYMESKLPLEPASPLWLCAALSRTVVCYAFSKG